MKQSIYFEILEMTPTLTLTLIERILDFVATHINGEFIGQI